jgi:Mlc titration factor MtfA (ptsG expression regulator)
MTTIYIFLLIALGIFAFKKVWSKDDWKHPKTTFLPAWRTFLNKKVGFYISLNKEEKDRFEYKIQEFLLNCRVTGINTQVNENDKLLVAASAVIPIFEFTEWRYSNLHEVLIYPGMFNDQFETAGGDRNILGMVGTGYMNGKMILSKKALHAGFVNETDKKNTAIHEFVHLIDKLDGHIDGVPSLLLEKQYAIPWLDLINKKIEEIYANKSDINPYGGTNREEFFSVTSEYFFERPKLLAKKHPELYKLLQEVFDQDPAIRKQNKKQGRIGRNSPCPCNSGLKFKKCCGKIHYS